MEADIYKHRLLIDHLPDAFASHQIVTDSTGKPVDYIFLEVNRAFEKMTGLSKNSITDKRVTAIFPGIENSAFDWIGTYGRVALTGESISFEQYCEPLGHRYAITAYSDEPGYFSAIFREQGKYLEIFHNAPTMMLLVNKNVCIEDINQAGLDFLGTTKEKIMGQLCGNLFNCINAITGAGCGRNPGCANCMVRRSVNHTFKTGVTLRNEAGRMVFNRATGKELRELLISTSLVKPESETMVLLAVTDITEQKRTEKALRESEALNRSIVSIIPDIIIKLNTSGKYLDIITSEDNKLFLPKEELLGKKAADFLPKEPAHIFMDTLERTFASNTLQTCEYELAVPAGNLFFEARMIPSGEHTVYALVRDINARKQAEAELRKREAELAATLRSIGDGVIVCDNEGRVKNLNTMAEFLTGWTTAEAAGRPLEEIFSIVHTQTCKPAENPLLRALHEGISVEPANHTTLISRDGSERQIADSCAPIRSLSGAINGAVLVFRDVTEAYRRREQGRFDLKFQTLVAEASGRFLQVNDHRAFDEAVNRVLASLGNLFEMDRSYLFRFSEDLSTLTNTHEWCRLGITAQKDCVQQYPFAGLPWWKARMLELRPVQIPAVAALPPAAAAEQELFRSQGIQSMLCLPICDDRRKLIGFIGFDAVRAPRSWPDEQVSMLQVIGEIMGSAILRMEAYRLLSESEEMFRQITENMGEVFWLRNADNTEMLYINPAYEKVWGRSCQSLYDNPRSFLDSIFEQDKPAVYAAFERYLKTSEFDLEYRILRGDGQLRWIRAQSFPVTGANGKVVRHTGIAVDITERKLSEQKIIEQSRLQEILMDIAGTFINVPLDKTNEAIQEALHKLGVFTDSDRAYIFAYDFERQTTSNTFEWCREGVEAQLHYLEHFPLENLGDLVNMHKSGNIALVQDVSALEPGDKLRMLMEFQGVKSFIMLPLLDGDTCTGFVGFDAVMKHRHYCEQEQTLLQLFAHMLVNLTNRNKTHFALAEASKAATAASAAKSEFLANMSHEIRTPMNVIMGMTEILYDAAEDEEQKEYLGMVKNSSASLLTIINDILDFSKIEAGRLELEAENFNLYKTAEQTIASFALQARLKDLELILSIQPDVPQTICGDPVRLRQILLNLLGNALKFTDAGEVLLSINKGRAGPGEAGDIGAPAEAGSSAPQQGEAAAPEMLIFSIKDTGVGIPREKQEFLFQSFSQVDGSITRKHEGTGLGLAISKKLVELMGGSIAVASETGRGSTFTFSIPLYLPGAATAEELPTLPQNFQDVHLLVIDDNKANRLILKEMLESRGITVQAASSGRDGLEIIRHQAAKGKPFDLVLLDQQMPGLDGFQVAEQINKEELLQGATLIMLSSVDTNVNAARREALGLFTYLVKPLKPSELFNRIHAALHKTKQQQPPWEGEAPAKTPKTEQGEQPGAEIAAKLQILLVDDKPMNRKLATVLLEKKGWQVAEAQNGRHALEMLAARSFDLVLMDIQMPEMDELEATRRIRAAEAKTGAHLPIIAMTAHAMQGDREQFMAAGMDGYVSKPISAAELYRAVEEAAAQQVQAEVAGTSASPGATGVEATVDESTPPPLPPAAEALLAGASGPAEAPHPGDLAEITGEVAAMLKTLGGDKELLAEMAALLLEDAPGDLEQLRELLAQQDGHNGALVAHGLKGQLANLGMERGHRTAQDLEKALREGHFVAASTCLAALEKELELLERFFARDGWVDML